jgi:hypothetical protein
MAKKRGNFRAIFVAAVSALVLTSFAQPARTEVTAEQVRTSITKGVAFLKERQERDGSWNGYDRFPNGVTALCTLALLTAGEAPDQPFMQRALDQVRKIDRNMTYTVALQTMVLATVHPEKHLLTLNQNVKWLEDTQIKTEGSKGGWAYPSERIGAVADNSNTQFAILALHEAQRVGVKVQPETWRRALEYWERIQNHDGSWGYQPGDGRGLGSMTSAGIASVVICSGRLSEGDAKINGDNVECCGLQEPNDSLERALAWMGRKFSVHTNPSSAGGLSGNNYLLYYLYGLERVGRMTAQRFLGEHDWYREGAEMLVTEQNQLTGAWKGTGPVEQDETVSTALALLFMSKGRRPVLMGKVEHGPGDDWNHHRSDLANLTTYVETKWKQELTWQVMTLQNAAVEDLLHAPVLFINGSRAPEFNDAQAQLLRDYVDRGGFIFAEACCPDNGGFDKGFRALLAKVFPEPEYGLRPLPPSHPVYYAEEPVSLDRQYVLEGVDYGCRTSVVYCPPQPAGGPQSNLSCLWELAQGHEAPASAKVQADIAAAKAIGVNVLAYATSREVKGKEESLQLPKDLASTDDVDRNKLHIAKLRHPGGCDAAPGALGNLLRAVGRELKLRVDTEHRQIDITDPALRRYGMVFMHGRNSFRLTEAERLALKQYIELGGTLLADAICANSDFADSFRREMKAIFPEYPLEELPAGHEMYTRTFGGFDLRNVSLRQPQGRAGAPLKTVLHQGEPQLEGVKVGERYGVIFSKYDLSCALEKHDSLECEGYTRDDAERIGLNVVLYALQRE